MIILLLGRGFLTTGDGFLNRWYILKVSDELVLCSLCAVAWFKYLLSLVWLWIKDVNLDGTLTISTLNGC